MNLLDQLNEVQRGAVSTISGPVMVIAGPGSGKTRVLTYRLAYLLQQGVNPWNILSLTFTNKAAKEMTERISHVIGPNAKKVWSGTFHSIFSRILRIEAEKIGFPKSFSIYDTDDSKSLINEIIKELNLNTKNYNPNTIRTRISSAKSNLITPIMYENDSELIEQDRINNMPYTSSIYKKYMVKCIQAGAMDFDDLLLQMYRLFQENPDNVLDKYRSQFQYLMVDEFQDTNYLQYAIIKKLSLYNNSPRNICIVGDDAQSIYSFRGATISNILDFESDFPDVQVFKLEQNYRSTNHIVQAANDVITFNKNQIKKEIWTEHKEGQKIKLFKTATDVDEGKKIVDYIVELKNRYHIPNKEIAILYRTNAQSRIFEEQLRRLNVPYKVFGGMSFYQRKEIKDLIAYIRLVVNTKDNEAFKRVINFPKRGLGDSTLDKFLQYSNENNCSLWQASGELMLSGRASASIQMFRAQIYEMNLYAQKASAYEAAMNIYKLSGLSAEMKSDITTEGISRLENVMALLDGIKEFTDQDELRDDETADRSLASYLQTIALITDQDQVDANAEFITLMSIHSAKGLEFDAVIVAGLEEKLFPSFMSMNTLEQLDEERRLFYVAITRARKHLILSYATSRYFFGNLRINEPSRFISEIDNTRFEVEQHKKHSFFDADDKSNRPRVTLSKPKEIHIDPKHNFIPSPMTDIIVGKRVLHQKFGYGKVLGIDGSKDMKIATIEFGEIDTPERKIILKYAKLQVLD
ncbi:MAG TPA: 3'-5' exonuclease [Saprospiraceae bacterium]|nr:3'-5' exonuclease [Saprospiraceae bacterium]